MSQVTAIVKQIIMNSNFNVSFYDQFSNLLITLDTATDAQVVGTYLICGDADGNSIRFFVNEITLIQGPSFSQAYTPIPAGFYQQDQAYFNRLSEIYNYVNTNIVSVVIRYIDALKFADGTTQTTAATGGGGSGTVTSVGFTAGTGITVGGTNPITTSGTVTITNSAPDQVVTMTDGTGIDVTGTYPSFTITNTAPDQTVVLTDGTGIDVTGTYPSFTITNTAPDQTVTLTEGAGIDITGTYPSFTIASDIDPSVFVPYTGATGDVNLGTHSITMDDGVTDTEMSPSFFGVENHAQTIFSLLEYDQLTISDSTIPSSMAVTTTGITFPDATTQTTAFTNPLTNKGDIFVRNSTANTRLPVGLDTQMLVADSSTTTGLKWTAQPAATPTGYYGQFQDDVTQTAPSSNVGLAMIFRTTDIANGISIVSNGTNLTRITFANTGVYNLQFSSQFSNSKNSVEDVTIWLRLNGSDVAGSSGFVSVPAKHGSVNGHCITSWNYLLDVVAGQYYELYWSTSDYTNVKMQYYPAGSPPPSTASVILTVTQQAGIMAGTGITAINSLTGASQTLATGTSGTDFGISSTGTTHTFNIPTASATNRGLLSSANWSTFNDKQDAITGAASSVTTSNLTASRVLVSDSGGKIAANTVTTTTLGYLDATSSIQTQLNSKQGTITLTTTGTSGAATFNSGTGALNIPQYAGAGAGASVQFVSGSATGLAAGVTRYGSVAGTTAETQVRVPLASACTINNLYVLTTATMNASASLAVTIFKNGSATAVTLTIAGGSAAGTYSDTSNSVSFAAGDGWNIRYVNSGSVAAAASSGTSFKLTI